MTELLVLGIGSPFGDDQLGWEVIKLLQQQASLSCYNAQRLQLVYSDRPGLGLLALIKHAKTVFLIDAVKTGAAVGALHRFQKADIQTLNSQLSSHALGVAQAIQLGHALDELPDEIVLYGIEIQGLQSHFNLSKPIAFAIKKLAINLEKDILSLLNSQD